jgi:hypothetical protein
MICKLFLGLLSAPIRGCTHASQVQFYPRGRTAIPACVLARQRFSILSNLALNLQNYERDWQQTVFTRLLGWLDHLKVRYLDEAHAAGAVVR